MRHAVLVLVLLAAFPVLATAGGEAPRWSLEIKGGTFHSTMDDWDDFYGDNRLPQFGLALGYKVWRPLEIGMELGYLRDEGQGFAPGHGIVTGEVKYQLLPVHLSVTLRGVFDEDQWLVPYVGAAFSRYHYRIRIAGQQGISGAVEGTQYRAGIQLLLDRFDPRSAWELSRDSGIVNTYLFVEVQKTEAETDGSDLGGEAYLGGLLFEF